VAFSITNWNINPNRVWYVRISDAGTTILVGLYLTEADADAATNRQAYGSTTAFGTGLEVTLTNETGATEPVSLFTADLTWHIKVTGIDGDATKVFKVNMFVDLPEINDAIYRNTSLIPIKAAAEINAHTHVHVRRSIALARHDPTYDIGDIVQVDSTRRDATALAEIESLQIAVTKDAIITNMDVVTYVSISR
jgi:hypothetical protein